jgi:hypothetical protein
LKVVDSVKDHKTALTKQIEVPDPLLEGLVKKVKKVLRRWDAPRLRDCQSESKAASYEVRRSDGGSTGFLIKLWNTNYPTMFNTLEFVGFAEGWCLGEGPYVREVYAQYPDYRTMLLSTMFFQPEDLVRPCFILEPLKVRTVTLSCSLGQRFLTPIQKSLWKFLSRLGPFRLIGEPLQESHIQYVVDTIRENQKILSGDWKASTDNLAQEVSRVVLEEILMKVESSNFDDPRILLDVIARVKGGFLASKIHYDGSKMFPRMVGVEWPDINETVEQTNGQLMGHKLSFLVLCLINFGIHWMSCEREEGRDLSLYELLDLHPCLCNGDDYLSVATETRYKHWEDISRSFGLEKSIGKNYYTRDLAQVNSTTYFVSYPEGVFKLLFPPKYHYTPFVNLGLLTGRGKGMDPESTVYPREGKMSTRFSHLLEDGNVLDKRFSSFIDVTCQEAPLSSVWRDLNLGIETEIKTRVLKLWTYQMDQLRSCLNSYGLNIPLPGVNPSWDSSIVQPLQFITVRENPEPNRFQVNFPEFSLKGERDFSLSKRIKRSKIFRKKILWNDEDKGCYPFRYAFFLDHIKNMEKERTRSERPLVFFGQSLYTDPLPVTSGLKNPILSVGEHK